MTPPGASANSEGAGLRADAERNRQRIVTAARAAFAELGLDVPMEEIARLAVSGSAPSTGGIQPGRT
ncbi:hypothetical protein LWC34_05775 [Kibdelosporangium philippinense]|uniref:HTH tetR-type domain-containing protein n=1 Tax=Kibdelosporangium philippinense TaxID=211113 RepID=A0ABS8Z336_9PSEU|nr:hypothetical protein [Kibdelosporangium philippinense]MCE7002341.1 hypothetical protein [Kibdelosporangium philippinense]